MAQFVITETQKKKLMKEASNKLDVYVDPRETNNDADAAIVQATDNIKRSGINPKQVNLVLQNPLNCGIIKTKQQIQEEALKKNRKKRTERLKALEENSKIYKVKDLIIKK